MDFVEKFITFPSAELLKTLSKPNLIKVAQYYEVGPIENLTKKEIKQLIYDYLVSRNAIITSPAEQVSTPTKKELPTPSAEQLSPTQKQEFERKIRRLELELKELKVKRSEETVHTDTNIHSMTHRILNGCSVNVMPRFYEEYPDDFFIQFERAAALYEWPEDQWPLLLENVFTGAAYKVYRELTSKERRQYYVVKETVLDGYGLNPAEYHSRFRNTGKREDMSFTAFIRRKENLLRRWVDSLKVKDFEGLLELLVMWEVRDWLPYDLKTYLDDYQVSDLRGMGDFCDHYANFYPDVHSRCKKPSAKSPSLTESSATQGAKPKSGPSLSKALSHKKKAGCEDTKGATALHATTSNPASSKRSTQCRGTPKKKDQCSKAKNSSLDGSSYPNCYNCKMPGHNRASCPEKKKNSQVGLVSISMNDEGYSW